MDELDVASRDEPIGDDRRREEREARHDQREPEPAQERVTERPPDGGGLLRAQTERAEVELTVARRGRDRFLLRRAQPETAMLGASTASSLVNRIVPKSAMPNTPPTSRLVFVMAEPRPAR